MEAPKITIQLRIAKVSDVTDINNKPAYGTMYFLYSAISEKFDMQPYYLSEETDMMMFKELFAGKQVFVPMRMFDPVEIAENE